MCSQIQKDYQVPVALFDFVAETYINNSQMCSNQLFDPPIDEEFLKFVLSYTLVNP